MRWDSTKWHPAKWLSVDPDGAIWDGSICVGVNLELRDVATELLRHESLKPDQFVDLKLLIRLPVKVPGPWRISWVNLATGEEGTIAHPTGERDHVERTAGRLNQVHPERLHWAINRAR